MGLVVQKTKGFIYYDHFENVSIDSRWEILPTNAFNRFQTGVLPSNLKIKKGNTPAYIFFTELTNIKEFVLDIKCSFNPVAGIDRSGIIVFAHYDDFITLEQYFDEDTGELQSYPYIRLIRDYNTYYAYYSLDGLVWNLIGTQDFDRLAPKIGLYIKGANGSDFDVDWVKIYRTQKITVNNLQPGIKLDLYNENDEVVETKVCRSTDTQVRFDLFAREYPFKGKFRLTIENQISSLNYSQLQEYWGGDVFSFEPNLDLYYENDTQQVINLMENYEEFLGFMTSASIGFKQIKLYIRNNFFAGYFNNVVIKFTAYNNTDHYSRLVTLAKDNNGVPDTFTDEITYSAIAHGEERSFYLKLIRENDPAKMFTTKELFFGLAVTSVFEY